MPRFQVGNPSLPRCCFSCLKPSRRLGVLLTQAREDSRCHWQGMESMGISDDGDIWRCDLGVSGSWTLWRCCDSTTFVTPTFYTRLLLKTGTFFRCCPYISTPMDSSRLGKVYTRYTTSQRGGLHVTYAFLFAYNFTRLCSGLDWNHIKGLFSYLRF